AQHGTKSDPTTPKGRAELRELLADATVRPWTIHSDRYGRDEVTARHKAGWNEVVAQVGRVRPDADLIVGAVHALPALLDALDKAEGQANEARIVARNMTAEANRNLIRTEKAEDLLERAE